MIDISTIDYSVLDRPEILMFLFHPRPEWGGSGAETQGQDVLIPVEDDIAIGARLYTCKKAAPTILFFHGNGEIAEDYDDMGPVYNAFGLNFLVADFRGYGRSTGSPGVLSMFSDAHGVMRYFLKWMTENQRTGPLWIMGRSLGSAPAIDLAVAFPDKTYGLIIESGFAHTLPLLHRLGLHPAAFGGQNTRGFSNADTLARFSGPTLILHGEYDQIIPVNHAHDLFERSPAPRKKLHIIEGADHNTILMVAGRSYFETKVSRFFVDTLRLRRNLYHQ